MTKQMISVFLVILFFNSCAGLNEAINEAVDDLNASLAPKAVSNGEPFTFEFYLQHIKSLQETELKRMESFNWKWDFRRGDRMQIIVPGASGTEYARRGSIEKWFFFENIKRTYNFEGNLIDRSQRETNQAMFGISEGIIDAFKEIHSQLKMNSASNPVIDKNRISSYLTQIKEHCTKISINSEPYFNLIKEYEKSMLSYYLVVNEKRKKHIAAKNTQKQEHVRLEKQKAVALKKRIADLKAGKIPVKTFEDAKLYYSATDGYQILKNPPLKADGKYYQMTGSIISVDGDYYQVEYIEGMITQSLNNAFSEISGQKSDAKHYFKFKVSPKISSPNFRANQRVEIIGKMINVEPYVFGNEISKRKRYQPVFKAVSIK